MATPYLSQISTFAFGRVPTGWLPCDGRLLPINQNQPLFTLLGTTYGGDGKTTFGLPNLVGRTPIGANSGAPLGQMAGSENVQLTVQQIPAHIHPVAASTQTNAASLTGSPQGNYPAAPAPGLYASSSNTQLDGGSSPAGGNQGHPNLQPYLAVQFCIAVQGVFPSRP